MDELMDSLVPPLDDSIPAGEERETAQRERTEKIKAIRGQMGKFVQKQVGKRSARS